MKLGSSTSLFTQNALERTSAAISRSLQRLSSGLRVNAPKDDVAAYSLGINLDSQIRGYTQGIRNINDGQALLQTASDSITTQIEIIQKMRELAVQASSGTLADNDRNAISQTMQSLFQEFKRITSSTQFNGIHLLDGSFATKALQIGASAGDSLNVELPSLVASNVLQKVIGTGTFQARTTVASGATPYQVKAADLNGDGKLDLISSDSGGTTLSILLGKGDGSFQLARTVSAGTNPRGMQIVDLNADGILDLVSADQGSNTVSIFLGNGDATFKPRTTLTGGTAPIDVIARDFNGDGKIDLASTGFTSSDLSIYLGNGDGTFGSRSTMALGTNGVYMDAGDFNSDGFTDLVAANWGSTNATILLGNGNGTFRVGTTLSAGTNALDPIVTDLNRDGKSDIVITNAISGNISIYLGNGDGTFAAQTTVSVGLTLHESSVADLDGDGILDLVATYYAGSLLYIFKGNGNGTFQAATTVNGGNNPTSVITDDLNGDGAADLTVSNFADSTLSILLANHRSVDAEANLNVHSAREASDLIRILDNAIQSLVGEQSSLSAIYSRLDTSSALNQSFITNFSEAKNLATNADLAVETSELVRNQILQQAQVAALTQANLSSQIVLKLLDTLR